MNGIGALFGSASGSAVTAFNLPGHYDSAAHLRSGDDLAERAREALDGVEQALRS